MTGIADGVGLGVLVASFAVGQKTAAHHLGGQMASNKKLPRPRALWGRDGTGVYGTQVTPRNSGLQSTVPEALGNP